MAKDKDVKVTVITYNEFTDINFHPPSNWFFKDALGNFNFVHTSKREVVQKYIDENYGLNKYKPVPVKDTKTKSKLESGGLSVYATATRAKGSSKQPK